MDVGNLGEGDLPLCTQLLPPPTSRSRPAGIHQIEVLPNLLTTYSYCFHLPLFQYFGIFLTEKTFQQRQPRLLLFLRLPLEFSVAYPEIGASEAGRIGING